MKGVGKQIEEVCAGVAILGAVAAVFLLLAVLAPAHIISDALKGGDNAD